MPFLKKTSFACLRPFAESYPSISYLISLFSQKMPLEPLIEKNLLQDIEASGRTRKEFNLLAYLDSNQNTYGNKGSQKRRDAQKRFDAIKRATPVSYLKLLDKNKVNSGDALKREIRSSNSSESPTPSKTTSTSDSDSEDEESDDKSTATPAQPPSKPPSFKPIKTPPPKPASMDNLTARFSNLGMPVKEIGVPTVTATMSSTGSSVPSTEMSVTDYVLHQVDALTAIKMDGSADYPYIIIVDTSKPEANWGFEVSFVHNVEVLNFHRDIYHIRKVTGVEQAEEWTATIPSKKYPALANRAVLIRGPSQDYWHQDAKRYHQPQEDKVICEPTKKAHMVLQTNINESKDRLYSHWLLVFPQGTEMENFVMSHDAYHVMRNSFELYSAIESWDPEKKKSEFLDLLGMDVHWRIAVKGGEMISSPSVTEKTKRRFAQRKRN